MIEEGAGVLRDAEAVAARELGSLTVRLRMRIFVPIVVVGIALGVVAYWVFREAQLRSYGMHMPYLTGAITFVPCFLGSGWLGRRTADAAVRLRMRSWCEALITRHRLAPGALDDYAALHIDQLDIEP